MKVKNLICAVIDDNGIQSIVFHYPDNEYCTFKKTEFDRQWICTWFRESNKHDAKFVSKQEVINAIRKFQFLDERFYIDVTYTKTQRICK